MDPLPSQVGTPQCPHHVAPRHGRVPVVATAVRGRTAGAFTAYYPALKSAYRDAEELFDVWRQAAFAAGRIAHVEAAQQMIVVRGDGIEDKSSIYHLGFALGDDIHHQSPYSQRDIWIGPLDEKNQLAAFFLAKGVAALAAIARSRGCAVRHCGDWNHLLCLARGLCYKPGGFTIKNSNAGVKMCM